MAALEDKVIDTATVVDAEKGRIYLHGSRVEDSERGGYGKISAARVFEVSSNVGIVKLIRKHYNDNPEKFIQHLERFGLTEPIGLPINGEGKPVVHRPGSKAWNKITLAWMSWGYSVQVTPLQTLMLYNAVANDGVMVKPRFIKELRKENRIEKTFETEVVNAQIASPETIKQMKKIMENVVIRGTADNIYSPDFSMAGKTGTAKKYISKRTVTRWGDTLPVGYSNKMYVASFAGFFPVEEPKYSCIVVIHEPNKKKGYYGATVAAPVFREIAQKIYTSTPVEREVVPDDFNAQMIKDSYATSIESIDDKKVPNVKGMPAMDAISLLENIGLKVKVKGIGKVKKQSIRKGTPIKKGATIVLNLS
jgi:cell division protein FtsI (penicillin-binding protein 3)